MCQTQHTKRTHLTQGKREVIAVLFNKGTSIRLIASTIDVHYTTVTRELTRNCYKNGSYSAKYAHKAYRLRRMRAKHGIRKIENTPLLAAAIEERLRGKHSKGDWSPAVIAHMIGSCSHQTIYTWIHRSRPDLRKLLPRCGKYRRSYGSSKRPSRGWTTKIRSITNRPEEINTRTTLGHYEGDTVVLNRSNVILTVVDRKSKFLIAELISGGVGIAYAVHEALVSRLSALPLSLRKSLTPDRGGEFAYWDMTEAEIPNLTFYFAHPHSPWERGTNEHTNGLLRRYFPKGEKHDTITRAQVSEVAWMINHRPRKSLNWETPCMVFGGCCSSS
jgi:transposase, IS30 family